METTVIESAIRTHVEQGSVNNLKCTQNCRILGEEFICRSGTTSLGCKPTGDLMLNASKEDLFLIVSSSSPYVPQIGGD